MAGSQPEYDVVIARNVMVPMRDGVQLATDIYRPARDGEPLPGPFPVILTRTPYDKSAQLAVTGSEFWAKRGYVRALQDVRGRFASEGRFYMLRDEGPDGYDTIEWLAARPWCDGQVGMIGTSYLGWVQSAAACHNPPHLRAMWANQSASNGLTSSLRHGGALELRWLSWAFWGGALSKEAQANPAIAAAMEEAAVHFRDWLGRLPLREGRSPLALIPDYERWALDLYRTGTAGAEMWQSTGLNFEAHTEAHADIPSVYSSGWYDSYTRAATENFARLSAAKTSPRHLLMGTWTHGTDPLALSYAGETDFGLEAPINGNLAPDFNHLMLAFFDRYLKGVEAAFDQPPVKLFVMGGGSGRRLASGRLDHGGYWRDEQEWPLARARPTCYHLHAGGGLAAEAPECEESSSSFRFDPEHPVPMIGGNVSSLAEIAPRPAGTVTPLIQRRRNIVEPGGFDQRERPGYVACEPPYLPLAARQDVLVFQTEPLAQAVEVTGPISVRLWASTSARDTDFTAKLIDVYPPGAYWPAGFALNLSDSIKRVRFRNGYEREELVEPGEVFPITIELYPTSNVFAAGHRIRLDISSSNFPRFDVNPNTGEPLGRHTHTVTALNAVFHDHEHPSHVDLPIVPA